MRARSLFGLLPLTLYLLGFTLVPVVSTLTLSLRAREGGITLDHFRRIAGQYQFGRRWSTPWPSRESASAWSFSWDSPLHWP